jgi:hypothetical protein
LLHDGIVYAPCRRVGSLSNETTELTLISICAQRRRARNATMMQKTLKFPGAFPSEAALRLAGAKGHRLVLKSPVAMSQVTSSY